MSKRIDDKETLVDIEKFRLWPYLKFILDPRTVLLLNI